MMKRLIAIMFVLSLSICAVACQPKPTATIGGVDAVIGQPTATPDPASELTTFPPVKMKDGWPVEGIFAKLPAYTHAGVVGQPSMPDTYNITGSTPSDFDAYCADLVSAGFVRTDDSSEGDITRYTFALESENVAVTVAYWPEYREIELLAETLDGSIDYSNKETVAVDWASLEYLSELPVYAEKGRIISTHSWRSPDSPEDFVKIVETDKAAYEAYKTKLEAAGFVQGEKANEGWHTESFYYTNPSIPAFKAELYYELNGLTDDNIIIGIVAIPE